MIETKSLKTITTLSALTRASLRGGVPVSEPGCLPLAETAQAWQEYAPQFIPLPHPSPRNHHWFKRHPWFERQLVPVLRARIQALFAR